MNIKRIFGALLTIFGIASLIYTAVLFANLNGGSSTIRQIVIYGILGIIFFVSGISLIKTMKDD